MLEMSGDWTSYKPEAQPGQVRRACKQCSSMLWWTTPQIAGIGVAGGAFLNPPLPEPTGSYQHADHVPWFDVPTDWDRVS